jgi:hypothetical protein
MKEHSHFQNFFSWKIESGYLYIIRSRVDSSTELSILTYSFSRKRALYKESVTAA